MCGRFVTNFDLEDLHALFGCPDQPNLAPNWNAAPAQSLPIIRTGANANPRLSLVRWGLIPHWAKSDALKSKPLINARCETAHQKPSFRYALHRRRALIPANGFYEWAVNDVSKTPYYVTRTDTRPMVFAGIWERCRIGQRKLDSFAILTTRSSEDMGHIHPRCPIMIDEENFALWLDIDQNPTRFFSPRPDKFLQAEPVSKRVNAVSENDHLLPEAVPDTML